MFTHLWGGKMLFYGGSKRQNPKHRFFLSASLLSGDEFQAIVSARSRRVFV